MLVGSWYRIIWPSAHGRPVGGWSLWSVLFPSVFVCMDEDVREVFGGFEGEAHGFTGSRYFV